MIDPGRQKSMVSSIITKERSKVDGHALLRLINGLTDPEDLLAQYAERELEA